MNTTLQTVWGYVWPWLAVAGFMVALGLVGTTVGGI